MNTILGIITAFSAAGGILCTIGAIDQKAGSLGAAAGGLFVCLGLCLYGMTKLEIAEQQAARDEQRQKATYPALVGLEASRQWAQRLVEEAVAELEPFQDRAEPLRELAQYLLVRRS